MNSEDDKQNWIYMLQREVEMWVPKSITINDTRTRLSSYLHTTYPSSSSSSDVTRCKTDWDPSLLSRMSERHRTMKRRRRQGGTPPPAPTASRICLWFWVESRHTPFSMRTESSSRTFYSSFSPCTSAPSPLCPSPKPPPPPPSRRSSPVPPPRRGAPAPPPPPATKTTPVIVE